MKYYDALFEINPNPNWPNIPNHPYSILVIGGSRSGKINVLLNLTLSFSLSCFSCQV